MALKEYARMIAEELNVKEVRLESEDGIVIYYADSDTLKGFKKEV